MVTCKVYGYGSFIWFSDDEIIARMKEGELEIINKDLFDYEINFANADDTYDQASRKAWFPNEYDSYEENLILSILNGHYKKENPRKYIEAVITMLESYGVKTTAG